MGEPTVVLNHLVLGSLGVVVGLVATFFGYAVFRLILPFLGFFYGYILGRSMVESAFWGFGLGVLTALVLAVLSYAYWSLLMTVGGAIAGFGLGYALGAWIFPWQWVHVLIGAAVAVLFAGLWFLYKDGWVMFVTAFAGAAITFSGLAYFWPRMFGWLANDGNWLAALLTVALGLLGFVVQMGIFAALHAYGAPPPGGPSYVIVRTSGR
jgi:hypothetical protein